jgi:hypothetical protein
VTDEMAPVTPGRLLSLRQGRPKRAPDLGLTGSSDVPNGHAQSRSSEAGPTQARRRLIGAVCRGEAIP